MEKTKKLRFLNIWDKLINFVYFYELEKKLLIIGFTFILSQISVTENYYFFYMPFIASLRYLGQKHVKYAYITLIISSFLIGWAHALEVILYIALFYIVYEIFNQFEWKSVYKIPISVLIATFINFMLINIISKLDITLLQIGYNVYISIFNYFLTLIFLKGINIMLMGSHKEKYSVEEVTSFILIIVLLLTYFNNSVFYIIGKVVILLVSFYGGIYLALTTSSIIAVFFLIKGISHFDFISIYIVEGIIISLLRKNNKYLVALLFLIIDFTFLVLINQSLDMTIYIYQSIVILLIFLVAPKKLLNQLFIYVEGTDEYQKKQSNIYNAIKDKTSTKIYDLSSIFKTMSNTLKQKATYLADEKSVESVYKNVCQECYKKEICWGHKEESTYHVMENIINDKDANFFNQTVQVKTLSDQCKQFNKVMTMLIKERDIINIKKEYDNQINLAKNLVGDQLKEVSKVMDEFTTLILSDNEEDIFIRDKIKSELEAYDFEVIFLHVEKSDNHPIIVDLILSNISNNELENIIIPHLSSILKQELFIKLRKHNYLREGILKVQLVSKIRYDIQLGIITRSKVKNEASGDNILKLKLSDDKYILAISDGMGSGKRAYYESKETLQLLGKMLKSGINPKTAVSSVNTIMTIRGKGEIFATVDMAVFNLTEEYIDLYKIMSAPTFIKREGKILKINAHSLPIGMVKNIDVDKERVFIKPEDMLIMMSDGISDASDNLEKILEDVDEVRPQMYANEVVKQLTTDNKVANDDMTLIVIKILNKNIG